MANPRAFCVAACLALGACGESANRVTGVTFTVSEFPGSGKVPWSCLPDGHTDAIGAGQTKWAVGAPLAVFVAPNYEHACGEGFGGEPCPDPQLEISAVDPTIWTVALGPTPGSTLGPSARYLEAVGPGEGGVRVTAEGRVFPPLSLHAVQPASVQFLSVDGPLLGATLTPITRLLVAAKTNALIVPRLLDGNGARLCGFATQTVTATGVTVTNEPSYNDEGRVNAPIQVGVSLSEGNVHVVASGVSGDLPVDPIVGIQ